MKTFLFAACIAMAAHPMFAPETGSGSGGGLNLGGDTSTGASTDTGAADNSPAGGAGPDSVAAPKPAAAPAPKPRASAAARAEAPKDDGLIEAVVRRGQVNVGTWDEPEMVGPGGTVRLPERDVKRLRADGTLVDPDESELPEFKGPTVSRG